MAKTVSFDVLAVAKGVGFDELGNKIKGIARDSQTHVSGLVTAIAAIGPALVPMGAAAAGALAGTGAAAGVALLAFEGIRTEMQQGTILGKAYQQTFQPIIGEFRALSYLAADRMFTGINTAVSSSRRLFPQLAMDVSGLAGQLGQIVSHLAPGLVALFTRLNPLFLSMGGYLVRLSAGFEKWAVSGTGVTRFVQYAQQNLPGIEAMLKNVATAVGRLVVGLAPLGGVSFSTIGVFAKLAAAIPLPTLRVLAPIIAGIIVATKAWQVATAALNVIMDLNPFVAVAAAIVGVGVALVAAYKHSQTFRDVIKTAFRDVKIAALTLAVDFEKYLLIPVLDVYSTIVHGAADAFGWVPGVGGKLKGAAHAFDAFRHQVDNSLRGLKIELNTAEATAKLGRFAHDFALLQNKQISITTYEQRVILPTLGTPSVTHDSHRAAGGPVMAGSPYVVGERGPELFVPGQSGSIVPNNRTGGAAGVTVHFHIQGSVITDRELGRTVTTALERWVGSGGRINIARGVK
jgi:hypothetical protein